jgi:hypothetical protein
MQRRSAAVVMSAMLMACGGRVGGDATQTSSPPSTSTPPSTTTTAACTNAHIAVETEPSVADIAIDDAFVYLLETVYPTDDTAATAIRRASRCDGTITTFAQSPQNPAQIAIDDENIYWVTSTVDINGNGPSSLEQVAKTGGTPIALRSSDGASGRITAVTIANGSLYWIEAGVLRSNAGSIAAVPNAHGKIVASGSDIFVPEYDQTQSTFDVRRIDLQNPNAPVVYPNADASAAMAIFKGDLYVDGLQSIELATPKGATTSPLGQAFAVTSNASDLFVTDLTETAGNSLFHVDQKGARTLLEKGSALGPSIMRADAKAVVWTDGGYFHLTPL